MRHCHFLKSTCDIGDPIKGPVCREGSGQGGGGESSKPITWMCGLGYQQPIQCAAC